MKIIIALLISLSLSFTMIAFADNDQTNDKKSNDKTHSCGCSKYKQKHK